MKKYVLLLAAASLAAAACSKPGETSAESADSQKVDISFDFTEPLATKASGNGDKVDDAIKKVQVFIFDNAGRIQAYNSAEGNTVGLTCTTGPKTVVGIANAPDLTNVTDLADLKSRKSLLTKNSPDAIVMDKEIPCNITSSGPQSIEVVRQCAKVLLSSVAVNFSLAQYQSTPVKIKSVFLTNVVSERTYLDESTPATWINKMKLDTGAPAVVAETFSNVSVEHSKTWSEVHRFYCFPNPTEADTHSATWSARHTRLVVEAEVNGVVCYYPVTLPKIERNHIYSVALTITRPGLPSPEDPSDILSSDFTITVAPWAGTTSLAETI